MTSGQPFPGPVCGSWDPLLICSKPSRSKLFPSTIPSPATQMHKTYCLDQVLWLTVAEIRTSLYIVTAENNWPRRMNLKGGGQATTGQGSLRTKQEMKSSVKLTQADTVLSNPLGSQATVFKPSSQCRFNNPVKNQASISSRGFPAERSRCDLRQRRHSSAMWFLRKRI